MNLIYLILIPILFLLSLSLISILDIEPFWLGKMFCKRLHWHKPENEFEWLGYDNWRATCKYCGKKILLDSQGNWF